MVSIIIPVYKVEKYLSKCIESIFKQTYFDLELILVDDGSPDNCPMICDEYAKKDSRIRVIHKKNGGLSDARNAGLEIATGEYIGFVDSDDWIEFNMWPNSGNTNFHLHFYANKESNFTCGGSGLNWTQKTFTWTSEQTNVVKKIEFLVVNKEEGSNALVLKLIIDGVEVAVLDNNITDPYATEPGAPVYFRMHTTNKASNFTVKSITWEPVE